MGPAECETGPAASACLGSRWGALDGAQWGMVPRVTGLPFGDDSLPDSLPPAPVHCLTQLFLSGIPVLLLPSLTSLPFATLDEDGIWGQGWGGGEPGSWLIISAACNPPKTCFADAWRASSAKLHTHFLSEWMNEKEVRMEEEGGRGAWAAWRG